jgi:hypothetical protein
VIIVEGPDGSGKTTLAHWLEDAYGLEYRRPPTLDSAKGANREVYEWWHKQFKTEGGIYDRCFFISELIYALATPNRQPLATDAEMHDGILSLTHSCDLLIFCLPPWHVQEQNLDDIGRLSLHGVDREALKKISWAYESFFVMYQKILFERVTVFDYTDMTHDHIREAYEDLVLAPK